MSGKDRIIGDRDISADPGIVTDMNKCHQQSSVTDRSDTVFKGRTVDGDIFPQSYRFSDAGVCQSSRFEAVILRIIADNRPEIDPGISADGSVRGDLDMGIDHAVVPDDTIVFNYRIGSDGHIVTDHGIR